MNRVAAVARTMLVVAAARVPCEAGGDPQTLTYPDLVRRMVDLELLAVLPEPGETCRQWSSYDRASRYDETRGTYVGWAANNDGSMYIRTEDGQIVMAEMEGPGCIWRVWSALTDKGHVKIYLDGGERPAVDLSFNDYFTGVTPPFNYPTLSYALEAQGSRGKNLYFPIPYLKSCKVVAEKGWGRYFHFTYTTFPKGTVVPTFSADLAAEGADTLRRVDAYFRTGLGADPAGRREGEQTIADSVTLKAGAAESMVIDGPRAITAIRGKIRFRDREDSMAALRSIVLRIAFDGQAEPAVWCPLGDFFGSAPGVNRYRSLPTGMREDGFYAYWYMPFQTRAELEVINASDGDRRLDYEIVHAPLARPFSQFGYFHCKWHRDIFPLGADRWPDWTMLRTSGRGRFCGVMLHVWNPRGGWWGEGDEKFFVDGEKFPSTIGTGSEDYFGYAWGDPRLFQTPYHCQTMTENNKGHQSVLRWHIPDNVPFQNSFEGCIEKYFGNDRGTLYACVACWYLSPDGADPIGATPLEDRHGYWVFPPSMGGGLTVLGRHNGNVQTQRLVVSGHKWHNDDQLWWTDAKVGDTLTIRLEVAKSGTYAVSATMTKAADYGIVQLSIDGKVAGEPIDLYNDGVIATGPVPLGTYELGQGEHRLTVEIVGANEKAVKKYMFGLDQVLLRPVE